MINLFFKVCFWQVMLSKVVREVMVVISMAILQMEETITPVTTVEMEVLPSATMATVVMEALQLVVSSLLSLQ